MSASIRGGKVVVISSSNLRSVLVNEFGKQRARNGVQGFEDTTAIVCCRREGGNLHLATVEQELQIFNRSRTLQVTLVVLQNVWDVSQVQFHRAQVFFKILKAFDILRHFGVLRICHKHNPIHAAQDQLARGVVNHLPRHCIKLKLCFETLDGLGLNRQEVKKQCSI